MLACTWHSAVLVLVPAGNGLWYLRCGVSPGAALQQICATCYRVRTVLTRHLHVLYGQGTVSSEIRVRFDQILSAILRFWSIVRKRRFRLFRFYHPYIWYRYQRCESRAGTSWCWYCTYSGFLGRDDRYARCHRMGSDTCGVGTVGKLMISAIGFYRF